MRINTSSAIVCTAYCVIVVFLMATIVLEMARNSWTIFGVETEPTLSSVHLNSSSGPSSVAVIRYTDNVTEFINANVVPSNIRDNLRFLTSHPHMAGTEAEQGTADWVVEEWKQQGLQNIRTVSYEVLLSFPDKDRPNIVRLISTDDGAILFESSPHQRPLYATEEADPNISDNFNAYSAKGNVTASLVYANYGRPSDFEQLQEMGVTVADKVVLARYGHGFRGDKVYEAEKQGAAGMILFSDPQDYAPAGYGVYPDTVMMPPSAAQFGTIKKFSGDVMTPFYPAVDSAFRLPEDEWVLPSIPVQPISYDDAYYIFQYLEGPEAPDTWQGGINVTYHLGPSVGLNKAVQLEVHTSNSVATVDDIIAIIEGAEEPDRYVLVGNHRDAWVFGSIDPSSGTASMMEVSRVLMALHNETGWRPRRTLVFCSWAAEEFGLIGSTEWSEQFSKQLGDRAVAYINVDQAFNGNYTFRAKSTPLMYDLLWDTTKLVPNPDPVEVASGRTTVFDTWLKRLANTDHPDQPWVSSIASGSDFYGLQQVLGVPSMDIRYTHDDSTIGEPLYHTVYETFALVDELYDSGFLYHSALTAVWAQLAVALADAQVLPFSPAQYPVYLEGGMKDMQDNFGSMILAQNISLDFLQKSVESFFEAVDIFLVELEDLDLANPLKVRAANDRLMMVERAFLDPRGLPDRPNYQHVVTSPSASNTYFGSVFPGLLDTLTSISVTEDDNVRDSLWRDFRQHLATVTHLVTTAGAVLSDRLW